MAGNPILIVSSDDPAISPHTVADDRKWARCRCRDAAKAMLITLELWPDLMPGFTAAEIEAIRNIANWNVE
jgi:hypothetical protein